MSHPAVFLDRDGTLIDDAGYLSDPAGVRIIDGVPEALRLLADAGYRRIVISNQSGIGHGHYTADDFRAVESEMERQLAKHGVTIDAALFCPHLPDAGCLCRKPGTALHREAAARFDIDLARSWYVGDRLGDIEPAQELAGHGMLVCSGQGERHIAAATLLGAVIVADLLEGAHRVVTG